MKIIYLVTFLLISIKTFCQNFTIGGYPTNSIYIGIDNILEIQEVSYKKLITSIKAPREISIKNDNGKFILQPSKPSDQIWIKLYSESALIDSIKLKSERISFEQFFKTKDYGLIVSGSYSKEILQNLSSILIKFNVPWIETPIIGFEIIIFQKSEALYKASYKGDNIDDFKIKVAIAKLEKGGSIEIRKIRAVFPYDDGDKAFEMKLICK